MKKRLMVLIGITALVVAAGCAKGYESQKFSGGLGIALKADRYPLVKGDNKLGITVTDASKKAVTDARVEARFYMPPMPGMAPMESTAEAVPAGGRYLVTVNPGMEGGWKLDITVVQPGKPAVTVTYNLDAR